MDKPAAPQRNTLAIVSLVFGLIGLVGGLVGWFRSLYPIDLFCLATGYMPMAALVAIVTGHEARTRLREGRGAQTGGSLALAGLIIGYTIMVMAGLVIVWTVLTVDWSQVE